MNKASPLDDGPRQTQRQQSWKTGELCRKKHFLIVRALCALEHYCSSNKWLIKQPPPQGISPDASLV